MDLSFGVLPCSGSDGWHSSSRQWTWECIISFHFTQVLFSTLRYYDSRAWDLAALAIVHQNRWPCMRINIYARRHNSLKYIEQDDISTNSHIQILLHSIRSQEDVVHRTWRVTDFAMPSSSSIYAIFARSRHKRLSHSFLKYTAYVAQRRKIIPWDKCLVFWPSRISRVSGSGVFTLLKQANVYQR